MVSVLTLVFAFQSSAALAFAFGMAVTGTITITTLLFFYIVRHQWRKPLWLVVLGGGGFLLTVDLLFLAANLTKLVHGAWLPLLIGVDGVHRADHLAARPRSSSPRGASATEGSLRAFIDELHDAPARRCSACPGTAVFLNRGKDDDAAGDARQRRAQPRRCTSTS